VTRTKEGSAEPVAHKDQLWLALAYQDACVARHFIDCLHQPHPPWPSEAPGRKICGYTFTTTTPLESVSLANHESCCRQSGWWTWARSVATVAGSSSWRQLNQGSHVEKPKSTSKSMGAMPELTAHSLQQMQTSQVCPGGSLSAHFCFAMGEELALPTQASKAQKNLGKLRTHPHTFFSYRHHLTTTMMTSAGAIWPLSRYSGWACFHASL